MILKCSCKHKAQDEFHGVDMRVHTTNKNGMHICTVCKATKTGVIAAPTKKKK